VIRGREDLRAKGVDRIACISVNDAFVMAAWGAQQNVGDDVLMLADGNVMSAPRRSGLCHGRIGFRPLVSAPSDTP
jgi:peroxiredoxin